MRYIKPNDVFPNVYFGFGSSAPQSINFLLDSANPGGRADMLSRYDAELSFFTRSVMMSKWLYFIFFTANLVVSSPVFAKAAVIKAIDIKIEVDGRPLDTVAVNRVRQISGAALARGDIDIFIVDVPKSAGQLYIEGGLSACVELGYYSTQKRFNTFIKNLRSVRPKAGTTVIVTAIGSCPSPPVMCGGTANKKCPVNQICMDDARDSCVPTKGGKGCLGSCKNK